MTRHRIVLGTRRRASRGFSLIEAAISIVIVGGLLVAALTTVAQSSRGLQRTGEKARGTMLAQQLMAEILLQDYEEPVDTPGFGRESSESGGDRTAYDDVDDYNGWSSSPPEYKDGKQFADLNGWERSVAVVRVNPSSVNVAIGSDQGVKRITVAVTYNGLEVASLTAVRTLARDTMENR